MVRFRYSASIDEVRQSSSLRVSRLLFATPAPWLADVQKVRPGSVLPRLDTTTDFLDGYTDFRDRSSRVIVENALDFIV